MRSLPDYENGEGVAFRESTDDNKMHYYPNQSSVGQHRASMACWCDPLPRYDGDSIAAVWHFESKP